MLGLTGRVSTVRGRHGSWVRGLRWWIWKGSACLFVCVVFENDVEWCRISANRIIYERLYRWVDAIDGDVVGSWNELEWWRMTYFADRRTTSFFFEFVPMFLDFGRRFVSVQFCSTYVRTVFEGRRMTSNPNYSNGTERRDWLESETSRS